MAAHDLRNSVQIVMSCVRMFWQSKDGLTDLQRKFMKMIDSSAVAMSNLIDQYLDVSRIEAGKLEIYPEPIDLVSLVEERLIVARIFAEQAGVRLLKTGSNGPVISNIDSARINQALDNLLLNAIKFSPTGAEVEVSVSDEGEISVLDQGPGIPAEDVNNLFKPFETSSPGKQLKKSGTGLGLHITKRVVEANKGRVWFRNRSPRGSVFSMSFPLSDSSSKTDK